MVDEQVVVHFIKICDIDFAGLYHCIVLMEQSILLEQMRLFFIESVIDPTIFAITLVFFGANSLGKVHGSECCVAFGVLWLFHVAS